jgi:hypothetical protein
MVNLDNLPPASVDASHASALRELLERGPLYRKYSYTKPRDTIGVVVNAIQMYCPVCRHEQPFALVRDRGFTFTCRACARHTVHFYLHFGELDDDRKWMMKVGQYPAAEERMPKELEGRLAGSDLDYYQKALRSRAFGFGLASLAYLRRVVENRTNDLLDLVAEAAAEQGGAEDVAKRVADAKTNYQFDQKVDLAAEILPASLKPGALNPLDALHDLSSAGIHRMTEEECLDLFDNARTGFEYVFKRLQVDRADAREYIDAMKKLQQAREQSTKRTGERPPATGGPRSTSE